MQSNFFEGGHHSLTHARTHTQTHSHAPTPTRRFRLHWMYLGDHRKYKVGASIKALEIMLYQGSVKALVGLYNYGSIKALLYLRDHRKYKVRAPITLLICYYVCYLRVKCLMSHQRLYQGSIKALARRVNALLHCSERAALSLHIASPPTPHRA